MNDNIESYKKRFKENIEILINNNKLNDAKIMLGQYENIVKDDLEVYSMKSVIAMMEENVDEAEEILKKGLKKDSEKFDLLYNLAYVYQLKKEYLKSFKLYTKAKNYTKDLKMINNISEILNEYAEYDEIKKSNTAKRMTIIIPTYNQKEYLKEAIESCLKQTYDNLEILVGDDCSTDGTDIMMNKYKNNKKIKYIRNLKNLGAGNNSTYLLENHVDSKYAMILNHDDYLLKKEYISEAIKFLNNNPSVSFVWANCKIKNEITGEITKTTFKNKKIINGKEYFINYETGRYSHITGVVTTVFDLEKLRTTQYGQEKTKSRDTFLYLNLMLVGDVGFIDECVSVYRIHKNGISFNMPLEFDQSTLEEFEKLKNLILKNNTLLKNKLDIWINNRVVSYVFWRFCNLWNAKQKKEGLNLLFSISKKYPLAYEKILEKI